MAKLDAAMRAARLILPGETFIAGVGDRMGVSQSHYHAVLEDAATIIRREMAAEIDALCERLNSGGESEAEAHRREIGPEAWEHQKVRCEGTCGRTFHPMELDENWKCRDCRGA